MQKLMDNFSDYQQKYANKTTKLMNYIGSGALIVSILMLLNWVSIDIAATWKISFAWLLVLAAAVYYGFQNIKLAVLTTLFLIILTFICKVLATATPSKLHVLVFLLLFVGGGVVEFLAQRTQGEKFNLMNTGCQLLNSPAFFAIELATMFGFKDMLFDSKPSATKTTTEKKKEQPEKASVDQTKEEG